LLALAAAALIVIGLSVPFVMPHHTLNSSALINFETTSQNRGIEERTRPEPGIQMFQRKRLDLTVALPRGSNDGKYEFQIKQTDDPQVLVDTTGDAKIENGLTTFRASVDLSDLPPGTYLARVRRLPAGNWRDLPVQIK
jgi:hypothetical protein